MRLVWSRKKGTEYGLSSRSSRQPPSTMHCHRAAAAAAAAELVPNKLVLRGAITAMNDAAAAAACGGATAAMGTEARFSIPLYIDARWLFFHANGSFFNAYTHCS